MTTIVSIYQAGESLYNHFDKVCLIYEGKMAYFGPAKQARQYFIDMGYQPAPRQTTADFLVAGQSVAFGMHPALVWILKRVLSHGPARAHSPVGF